MNNHNPLQAVTVDGVTYKVRQADQSEIHRDIDNGQSVITVCRAMPAEQQLHELAKQVGYAWLSDALERYGDAPAIPLGESGEALPD